MLVLIINLNSGDGYAVTVDREKFSELMKAYRDDWDFDLPDTLRELCSMGTCVGSMDGIGVLGSPTYFVRF